MSEVFFYHLTRDPLEVTLPVLLGKSLAAGWRIAVRGREAARMDWLDGRLWKGRPESFLPHGRAGGPHDADQPILLVAGAEAPGEIACLISVDGAELSAEEIAPLTRAMVLFDGNDPEAVEHARGQWKALTGAGVKAKYWSQQDGPWALKAQS